MTKSTQMAHGACLSCPINRSCAESQLFNVKKLLLIILTGSKSLGIRNWMLLNVNLP
jgi:hypothetical protein